MTTHAVDPLQDILNSEAQDLEWIFPQLKGSATVDREKQARIIAEARTKILAWVDGLMPPKFTSEEINSPDLPVSESYAYAHNTVIEEIRTRAGLSGGENEKV